LRKLPVIFAVSALALTLAGCSGSPSPSPSPTAAGGASAQADVGSCTDTPTGDASESVEVTGDAGAKASATFDAPLSVDATQRTVLSKGAGDTIKIGDLTSVNFTLFNGTSGDEVFSTYDSGHNLSVSVDQTKILAGIVKGIECVPANSRVVAVVPPAEAFGDQGSTDLGITASDTSVFVIDIGDIVPDRASGADQPAQEGMPTVTLADDGTPTVTIPDTEPSPDLQVAVLKKGDGAVVQPGADVTAQYQGLVWGSKKIFDQSWGKNGPSPFSMAEGAVIPGFSAAIVGQTVGSQVIVSIPPAQGYGDKGNEGAGITGTDTLVFVVDILATS
jgi:FKBP-type peptidyl-prolyl cis-trans isomerase